MIDWTKIPDLGAIALLTCAFGSVARRCRSAVSSIWLTGWGMIGLHFAAFSLVPSNPLPAAILQIVGIASLTWAGVLFMWASVPYRRDVSSTWMLVGLLAANTLYVTLIMAAPTLHWALVLSALALGTLPLTIALISWRRVGHQLRWTTVFLYLDLSIFLLSVQGHGNLGPDLALNAVLFAVYLGCGIHFWYAFRRASAGAFITIAGFFFWAAVFVIAPFLQICFPAVHLEAEVWNLPKYVVAVGMMLLVLENQIEHTKYLALHDELTGLPNRRLFQDRLSGALERARRNGSQAILLLIDLDDFKRVNDTVGHHIGDQLLKRVAEIFAGRVRRSDTVARTGGDEFAVILEEPVSREAAVQLGQSLNQLLRKPIQIGPHALQVGASVGVAVFPDDADACETMCIAADRVMYAQKKESQMRRMHVRPALGDNRSPEQLASA